MRPTCTQEAAILSNRPEMRANRLRSIGRGAVVFTCGAIAGISIVQTYRGLSHARRAHQLLGSLSSVPMYGASLDYIGSVGPIDVLEIEQHVDPTAAGKALYVYNAGSRLLGVRKDVSGGVRSYQARLGNVEVLCAPGTAADPGSLQIVIQVADAKVHYEDYNCDGVFDERRVIAATPSSEGSRVRAEIWWQGRWVQADVKVANRRTITVDGQAAAVTFSRTVGWVPAAQPATASE